MKKEEVRGLVVYTILLVAALIVGLAVIKPLMDGGYYPNKLGQFGFIIIVLVIAYLVNAIGIEILHVLGAVVGGYAVKSFNVLGMCIEKSNNKWNFHFREFDGLTGETKIVPKKEKLNLNPFTWCPIFGYAAEMAGCIVISSMIKKAPEPRAPWLATAAVVFILVSSMLAFYNLIPLKLDATTDGYRMRLAANPVNVKAYNEVLKIEDAQREGKSIEKVPYFEEITEYTAQLNELAVYQYLSEEKLPEAEQIIDKLLENEKVLNHNDACRLIAQKLYIVILTKSVEEAKELYDKMCTDEIRRFIANDVSMPSIRAYILIAGMIEGSEGEVKYARSKIEKAKKKAYASQIATEEKLLEKAIEYVYKNHPKWSKENAAE